MISPTSSILVIDDDATSLFVLSGYLKREGYAVVAATSGEQALALLAKQRFDLLISDLRMPGMDGIMLLEEIRRRDIATPLIIVTACGSIASAVEAIRKGAYDYIEKPFNPDNLQLTVERVLNYHRALSENSQIKAYLEEYFTFQNLITVNPAMKQMLGMAARVASSPRTTVAIYGESGTGKEVLARAIHFGSTGMPTRFVAVNCAAIPEQLLESELFGHVKGSFTGAIANRVGRFALADKGTLFLDEIGDMPTCLQVKLLRVLQNQEIEPVGGSGSRKIDTRIIAATHQNLEELVAAKVFREDLYYRLSVIPLVVPPLRERQEDIPLLVDSFLKRMNHEKHRDITGVAPDALQALCAYHWPGNIRELENLMERLVIIKGSGIITCNDLPAKFLNLKPPATAVATKAFHLPGSGINFNDVIEEFENSLIMDALTKTQGNKKEAAELLNLKRTTLIEKLKKKNLALPGFQWAA